MIFLSLSLLSFQKLAFVFMWILDVLFDTFPDETLTLLYAFQLLKSLELWLEFLYTFFPTLILILFASGWFCLEIFAFGWF